ncbi:MAG: hypothetical protein H3C51_08540 [Rubellimicrobium sp.]|nr:hypothetical protein [Rubellimicrobium sp.]
MRQWISRFRQDESGAITVDWVVLTAAVVALVLAVVLIFQDAIIDPATGIGATIAAAASVEYDF